MPGGKLSKVGLSDSIALLGGGGGGLGGLYSVVLFFRTDRVYAGPLIPTCPGFIVWDGPQLEQLLQTSMRRLCDKSSTSRALRYHPESRGKTHVANA